MPTLAAGHRDEIAALLDRLDVDGAFERLARFPDLKQTDLPPLDKKTLGRIGASPEAARAFVAGLVSPSLTVRRMTRKHAPKLPGHGPGALLLMVAECVRPFRRLAPGESGLAGRHGQYATPLGPAVVDAKLSFEIKNPNVAVYSAATRVLKDAVENLAGTVALAPDEIFLRAFEYTTAAGRPFSRIGPLALPDDGVPAVDGYRPSFSVDAMQEVLSTSLQERGRKEDKALLAAAERWARAELLLDDEAAPGSAEAALRARWHEWPEEERRLGAATLPLAIARLLGNRSITPSKRMALYWHLKTAAPRMPDKHASILHMLLASFERDHPADIAGDRRRPCPGSRPRTRPHASLPRRPARRRSASRNP